MTKRTRTQVAEEIAIGAVLFVKRAREAGHVNRLEEITLWEIAQSRDYNEGTDFSIKTVRRLARESARLFEILDYTDI